MLQYRDQDRSFERVRIWFSFLGREPWRQEDTVPVPCSALVKVIVSYRLNSTRACTCPARICLARLVASFE